jgi:muconolactone delta-isomerase
MSIKYSSRTRDQTGLRVYSDADYAGDPTGRHSTTGILILWNGQPVHWKSSKQSCVAQSTTEAEYIAASTAYKEVLWLRQLLAQVLDPQEGFDLPSTPLHIDNQSALQLASTIAINQRSKHIDVRYHAIREGVAHKQIALIDTDTQDQLADLFTKPLALPIFRYMLDAITRNSYAPKSRIQDQERTAKE